MSKHGLIRQVCTAAVLAALTLGGMPAWADEPPPEDFPPPASEPKADAPADDAPADDAPVPPLVRPNPPKDAAPQPPAAKKPAGRGAAAWSPPAVTPGGGGSILPPPQIVRRRGSTPRTTMPAVKPAPTRATPFVRPPAPTPMNPLPTRTPSVLRTQPYMPQLPGTPPTGTYPTGTPTTRPGRGVTPSAFPVRGTPPRPPPPPLPASGPTVRLPALTTPTPAPAPMLTPSMAPSLRTPTLPTAPRSIPAAASATRVFGIAKTHNVALGTGDLALQMDVDYEVRGQDGRQVYVAIWFVRSDTGAHVRAAMTTYADTSGFLTLQTRSAQVRGNSGRFTAALKIPYRAFPVAQPNDSYEVSARVQILRADGGGRVASLAKGSTTFRVYGYTDEAPAAP